jgi:hypothetical protein
MAKIMGNPTTRAFMSQPDFVTMFTVRAGRCGAAALRFAELTATRRCRRCKRTPPPQTSTSTTRA